MTILAGSQVSDRCPFCYFFDAFGTTCFLQGLNLGLHVARPVESEVPISNVSDGLSLRLICLQVGEL